MTRLPIAVCYELRVIVSRGIHAYDLRESAALTRRNVGVSHGIVYRRTFRNRYVFKFAVGFDGR